MELAVKALQLWREKKITTVRMYVLTGMDVWLFVWLETITVSDWVPHKAEDADWKEPLTFEACRWT
jgi:hypothetical protein